MKSRGHALISLAVAAAVWIVAPPASLLVLLVVVVGIGVGIDFDHFLVARLNTGSWRGVRRCLRNPAVIFLDQDEIFEEDALTRIQRLFSHTLIGGVVVGVAAVISVYWATVVAITVYTHVVADLFDDVRHQFDADPS